MLFDIWVNFLEVVLMLVKILLSELFVPPTFHPLQNCGRFIHDGTGYKFFYKLVPPGDYDFMGGELLVF